MNAATCEVADYVLDLGTGDTFLRTRNEAANTELVRRGRASEVEPSGEVSPYAIAWVNTCGGPPVLELPEVVA